MDRPILRNKLYLYLTEFFAGMSVMAVELGASRLLAPYFSSSQIVWTIIIGTIMIAMALGNLYGGRMADKDPNPDKLYKRIIIAALWIAAIPVVGKYVILVISGLIVFTVNTNFLVIAGFVACMVIFVFPLFLLGTVTPSLVKFSVDSLDDSGSVVGKLNASNTIGSIIGTFVPTFISIPAVGTAITFLIFAGILLILCIVYFVSSKINFSKAKRVPVSIVLFLVCCLLGHSNSFAFWQTDLTYEGESIYNYLQVHEEGNQVILSTNVLFGVQSVYQKDKGPTGLYYDYAMAALPMADSNVESRDKDNPLKILILGNGSGTFATQCDRYYENLDITGVEIDEKITKLATEYFGLSEDIPVVTYDGRAYLNAVDDKYDVILVDAYQDITIPFQMSSQEFFQLVADHLEEDGVMVVNLNMRSNSPGNINEYLADTIASVFPNIYTAEVLGCTNRILYASFNDDITTNLGQAIEKEKDSDLFYMMSLSQEGLKKYKPGNHTMTDDKAPVELLGMKVIDELISDELTYYKTQLKEEGIQGILNSF
ncbi:Spermidine synthase [Pseudobutyrivibrio sp. YE44]|uniref:spermidine synthase n=1 Tax=Pseudobutyrivibrio sp. YE44 TaxID=1520802 RepID=UPI00087F073D|nr:fused MFS/spermidine synthase [Pseudobutyrivibrio sp. YE44]SDB50578.1 Spermidine synthase [Pseudobutyrivibrio sp. YE44]